MENNTSLCCEISHKSEKWKPFKVNGLQAGQEIVLKKTKLVHNNFSSGFWSHKPEDDPSGLPYEVPGIEAIFIVQGEAEVIESNGNKILLQEGNSYSFSNGFKGTWITKKPLIKFSVSVK